MNQLTGKPGRYRVELRRPLPPAWWLVSYPRSGSSFVRALLANYFSGLDRPLSLAEISSSSYGDASEPLFKALTGKSASERSLDEDWSVRLPYFEKLRRASNPILPTPLIRSHTVFGKVGQVDGFKFTPEDRIVHIVRHPCDVAISYAHFSNLGLDEAIDAMNRVGAVTSGAPDRGYSVYGSWAQHTRSWLLDVGAPVLQIPYARLVAQTADVLTRLVSFFGHDPDGDRIARAVAFSGFEQLQSQERNQGFVEASRVSEKPYFREGRQDQWRDVLTAEQARRLLDADPQLIKYLAFTEPSAAPPAA